MDFLNLFAGINTTPAAIVQPAVPTLDTTGCGVGSDRSWIQTYTGKSVFPARPEGGAFDIVDIAHALALVNRYTGHTRVPYSVAEHSVRVMQSIPFSEPKLRLAALMHDASEAYLADLARPVKVLPVMVEYRTMEARLQGAIEVHFGINPSADEHERIKYADNTLLATEKRDLMARPPSPWGNLPAPLMETITPWSWDKAKHVFLESFYDLQERLAAPGEWGD